MLSPFYLEQTVMANGFAERWPRWPSGAVGKTVLAVQVGCSVDTLFETAFGNESEFSVGAAYDTGLLTLHSQH